MYCDVGYVGVLLIRSAFFYWQQNRSIQSLADTSNMNISLVGKRAIVTAAASGLGRIIAQALVDQGAEVFVGDNNPSLLLELPPCFNRQHVDVSDPDAVQQWLQPIVANGIDVLINNAGIAGPIAPLEAISAAGWQRCLAVNLHSQFYCASAVLPSMKAAGTGVIINIASTAGLMGMPLRAPYVASKFAVIGLTKALSMEVGRDGIRVNAIAPGSINGDRMEQVIAAHLKTSGSDEASIRSLYTQGVSMATFVDADEIADMVLYLCSDHARHITGQIMVVDGGTETLYPRMS